MCIIFLSGAGLRVRTEYFIFRSVEVTVSATLVVIMVLVIVVVVVVVVVLGMVFIIRGHGWLRS